MPRRCHRLAGAALCGAVFLTGCANQLPQRSELEERVERKLLDHKRLQMVPDVRSNQQEQQLLVQVKQSKQKEQKKIQKQISKAQKLHKLKQNTKSPHPAKRQKVSQ